MDKKLRLENLNLPKDIKQLTLAELKDLASQIRSKLIQIGQECGGHLASNLGVVELTLALHSVFDSPKDKIIWDVSHQIYVHKILTGRLDRILTIRKYQGLSGFAKPSESEHDIFVAGHASTSISAALGIAHARDLQKKNFSVISIIGDGSISGGMCLEALNSVEKLKSNFIVILNDNDMSISKPKGALSAYMTRLRTSFVYNKAKKKFEDVFDRIPKIGVPLKRRIERAVDRIRDIVIDYKFGVIFEEFGFRYLGPIDGHNIPLLMAALRYAKNYQGPIMIHISTKKGKGHIPAEQNPVKYHGLSPQNKLTTGQTFTQRFGQEIIKQAQKDKNIVVITPAMQEGSGLREYAELFPDRFFDVGIAEEHAVTFSAGLAKQGLKPVLAIYSTFLQRGYDQLIHDICLQNLPVIIAIDRSGLVGEDGPTHHGVFDTAFMLHIPNLTILAPKDGDELAQMLALALAHNGPIAIKYPKNQISKNAISSNLPLKIGKAEVLVEFNFKNKAKLDYLLIASGYLAWEAYDVAQDLSSTTSIAVINLRSLKPLDISLIKTYLQKSKKAVVLEENSAIGGVYSYILQQTKATNIHQIALPDKFIEHGSNQKLRQKYNFTKEKIISYLKTI